MSRKEQRFAILDCDGGIDDAWALLLLLRGEQCGHLQLLAVTINGCGNTTLEHAARNMRRILTACSREDVPIYLGAVEPLMSHNMDKKYFYGVDGFSDCLQDDNSLPLSSLVQPQHAVMAIHELCQARPQQITIFAVGPLTNLALGYSMYGEAFGNFKDLYIMGGNYRGVGNTTRSAEFNFYADPEAAHAVLLKTRCPITILPLEPCLEDKFEISVNWRLDEFGKRAADVKHLAVDILTRVETALYRDRYAIDVWNPYDALVVAAWLFDKQFVKKYSKFHATVELAGTHTRGQMVLDHLRELDKYPENVRIIELVDDQFFKQIVEWAAGIHSGEILIGS